MVKVAVVWGDDVRSDFGDHDGTGAAADCERLCAALAFHGHQVTAHPRQPAADAATQAYRVIPAQVDITGTVRAAEVLPFVGDWAAQLDRRWASDKPNVVHAFGWLGGLAAQLAARRHELPVVQSFHGLATRIGPKEDAERARLEPLLARGAAWVTGGCGDEVDALTRLRRNRARLSLLATGIDIEHYPPVGPKPPDGVHRILQLAPSLDHRYGLDRTIEVLPSIPNTELVIARTDSAAGPRNGDLAGLQRLAANLGVKDRVRFAKAALAQELSLLLGSADVLACTPQHAPRATAALQAMASGLVVVAVAVDSLIDTVINGVTGVLVSPTDPGELANALKSLQRQRFQRESMGSAGRCRVMSRFTWNRIALDALNIYHQALPQSVPSSRLRGPAGEAQAGAIA